MSDYATLVSTRTWKHSRLLDGGLKPYWVTPSADGRYCYISWSGSDTISRISYATGRIAPPSASATTRSASATASSARDLLRGIGFHDVLGPAPYVGAHGLGAPDRARLIGRGAGRPSPRTDRPSTDPGRASGRPP